MTSDLVPNPFLDVAEITYLDGETEIPAPRTVACKLCEKELYNVEAKDSKIQWLLIPEHFETHGVKVVMG
jgi:hypothetical protein